MNKTIITAGCSLTADDTSLDMTHRLNSKSKTYYSYPHYIKEHLDEDKKIYEFNKNQIKLKIIGNLNSFNNSSLFLQKI